MTLNEYQKQAKTTDILGHKEGILAHEPAYVAKVLGLTGEAGEVAEKYKKIIRDKKGIVSPEDKQEILKELGDVLWYIAVIADYLESPLEDVAIANQTKLASRKTRGKLRGKGDNR